MQYALLIYGNEKALGVDKDSPALREILAKHVAFGKEIGSARVGGAGLKATSAATTVRTTGAKKTIHDGPFAETKEQLGGFYIVEVPDLDAAIAVAKKVPLVADGAVEIRPLLGG